MKAPHLACFAGLFVSLIALAAPHARATGVLREGTQSQQVWIDGRSFFDSPQYYTTTDGDFAVTFRDTLPFGTKVNVHYGFAGQTTVYDGRGPHAINLSWEDIDEKAATAVSPYNWTATFSKTLHERGEPRLFDHIQFVIVVTLPDSSEYYVKGNDSTLGYFEASLPQASGSDADTPWRRLRLSSIERP
jgi:hypothetical protein